MEIAAKVTIGILLIFATISNAQQLTLTLDDHLYVTNSTTPQTNIIMPKGELTTYETTTVSSTNLNNVCTLCVTVAEDIRIVVRRKEFQKRIVNFLHDACSLLFNLKPNCIAKVNCYAFVFFTVMKLTPPRVLCKMAHLCAQTANNSTTFFMSEDKCEVCRYVVTKSLTEFKFNNKQLERIESVMKNSKAFENYKEQLGCMNDPISEYAPMILENAKQFLEVMDLCATTRACDSGSSSIVI